MTAQGGAIAAKAATKPTTRRSTKGRIKSSTVAVYTGVFVLLVSVIAIGYKTPQQDAALASVQNTADATQAAGTKVAVNDVVATNIAATVAQTASLATSPNITERAASAKVEAAYVVADSSASVAKPAIVAVEATTRSVVKHAVVEGDTAESVANKYGISSTTVKWANNLKSNSLTPGTELDILPRDGVLYTVKDGDTVEKIAEKYKADAELITSYNDLELNGLSAGLRLIVPGGELPESERPDYVAPRTYSSVGSSSGGYVAGYSAGFGGRTWAIKVGTPMYAGNKYAPGNCTAYAYDRRIEMGRPVGGMWGNAATWAAYASRTPGYTVNRTPAVGAIIQNGGGYGHVGVVERLLPNGDIEISEMNAYVSGGGFNRVSGRIVSAASVGQYMYIH